MAQWQALSLEDLLPSEIADLLSTATSVSSSIATILGSMADLANILKLLVQDFIDPIDAIVSAFLNEVDSFLADLKATGIYVLAIPAPRTERQTRSTEQFFDVIEGSLYDWADPNRPVFTQSASVGGIVLMYGHPTLSGVLDATGKLGKIFNIKDFKDALRISLAQKPVYTYLTETVNASDEAQDLKVNNAEDFLPEGWIRIDDEIIRYESRTDNKFQGCIVRAKHLQNAVVEPSKMSFVGEPPDWERKKVIDLFPSLGLLLKQLEALTQVMASSPKASDVANDFVQVLSDKANVLAQTASDLNTALTDLENDFQGTGFHLLKLPEETGGNKGFITRIKESTSQPFFSEDAFTVGVCIMAGTGGFSVLETFF